MTDILERQTVQIGETYYGDDGLGELLTSMDNLSSSADITELSWKGTRPETYKEMYYRLTLELKLFRETAEYYEYCKSLAELAEFTPPPGCEVLEVKHLPEGHFQRYQVVLALKNRELEDSLSEAIDRLEALLRIS
ncbi:MAG: hypothetical protein L3J47_00300 [Sulfurovum sp.]|nr:hypothetical protein [Sulfurovum sp.]